MEQHAGGSVAKTLPPTQSEPSARLYTLALFAILIVVAALYLPVCGYDFSIIDDHINVYQNPYLCNPASQNIAYLWTHPYFKLYMPLTYTAWALVARTAVLVTPRICPPGGVYTTLLSPAPFHILSLALHLLNTACVFVILARLRFRPWSSAAGALLFAVHPVQVQAVAWITGTNSLLGGSFGFLALILYLMSVPDLNPASSRNSLWHKFIWLIAATVAFACALLSKPSTVVFPLFIAIIELLALRRGVSKWGTVVGVWLAMALACVIVNANASSGDAGQVWSPVWGRPFVAGDALSFYMTRLVWPAHLTYDYVRKPSVVLGHWWGYATWVLPAVSAALVLRYRPLGRLTSGSLGAWLYCAAFIFVAGVCPNLGIVPFYAQFISTVWNHYLYLAMLGPAIALAAFCSHSGSRLRLALVVTTALLAVLAVLTRTYLIVWSNMSTLTESMLLESPESALAYHNQGMIQGAASNMNGAVESFRKEAALQIQLQHNSNASGNANYCLGMTLAQMGRIQEAVGPLQAAFDFYPQQNDYWYQLYVVLIQTQRSAEAETVTRRHLAAAPTDVRAEVMLGKMLLARQDATEALPFLDEACRNDPSAASIQFFDGNAHEMLHHRNEALAAYKRAYSLDPSRPQIKEALDRVQQSR